MKAREIWPQPLQVHTYQRLSPSIEMVSHQPLFLGQCSVSALEDYTFLSLDPGSCPWVHIQGVHPVLTSQCWIHNFYWNNRSPAPQKFFVLHYHAKSSLTITHFCHYWPHWTSLRQQEYFKRSNCLTDFLDFLRLCLFGHFSWSFVLLPMVSRRHS